MDGKALAVDGSAQHLVIGGNSFITSTPAEPVSMIQIRKTRLSAGRHFLQGPPITPHLSDARKTAAYHKRGAGQGSERGAKGCHILSAFRLPSGVGQILPVSCL